MVFSGKKPYKNINLQIDHPFIFDQINSLRSFGHHVEIFIIEGSGVKGYSKAFFSLKRRLKNNNYDIIHAHYGLSGVISVLQNLPTIVTFTGCDINITSNLIISTIARRFSSHNIFVSESLKSRSGEKKKYSIIPYGIEFANFFPIEKKLARESLKLKLDEKIVLFASSKNRIEKNYPLAKKALEILQNIKLIELEKNYSTEEMNLLINSADVLLMTSIREGSPQIIKEAMACNCPIVSTNVGDVKEIISNTDGCYITSFDEKDVAEKIHLALKFDQETNGRQNVKHLDVNIIGGKISKIYQRIYRTK